MFTIFLPLKMVRFVGCGGSVILTVIVSYAVLAVWKSLPTYLNCYFKPIFCEFADAGILYYITTDAVF